MIFIHGLTGDSRTTWSNEAGDEFWPCWLESDLQKVSVYTVGYPTSLFEKQNMDVFELAGTLLDLFVSKGIGEKPVVFIAHSFGGILTKLILRKSCESADDYRKQVSDATKLVVFLSTPHTGTSISNVLTIIPKKSKQLRFLANEIGYLEDLNEHYRSFANGRDDHVTVVYYEKRATNRALVVVPRKDADPGVSSAKPVALQKDHIKICKPYSRDDIAYLGIKHHVQKVVDLAEQPDSKASQLVGAEYYQERSLEDRRDLLQKLIDSGREHEYDYANLAQNRFAREYAKTGLYTGAREDNDIFLSEIETRFINHVYHPLICKSAPDTEVRKALQEEVINPLKNRTIGTTRFTSNLVLSGLYFLTEQCHIRWDVPK